MIIYYDTESMSYKTQDEVLNKPFANLFLKIFFAAICGAIIILLSGIFAYSSLKKIDKDKKYIRALELRLQLNNDKLSREDSLMYEYINNTPLRIEFKQWYKQKQILNER